MSKKRLSPAQVQENISRKAFAEFLERHEWVTTDVTPDLGEDFLVRVYENGISTGISCYIQLKSINNIEALRLKSGDVSYTFEVKDLEHWESQGVPVLLVIWDVNTGNGYYLWVSDAIKQLSSRKQLWRSQTNARIHFPYTKVFDENALKNVRHDLAIHFNSIISRDKDLVINAVFKFPTSGEGAAKMAEFERFIGAGNEVELDSAYISKFEFPDWWTTLHGEIEIAHLTMGPARYEQTTSFQIRFHSMQAEVVTLTNVALRMEKGGEKEVTFSNVQQETFYTTRLVINKETNEYQLRVTFNFENIDGYDARDALQIMRFVSEGCTVVVRNLEIKEEFQFPVSKDSSVGPPRDIVNFIHKLCRVQDEMGMTFTLRGDTFSSKDLAVVDELTTIFSMGRFEYKSGYRIKLAKPTIGFLLALLERENPLNLRAISDEVSVTLLNKTVSLGPATVYIEGMWEASVDEVKSWLESATDDDVYNVNIPRAVVTQVYERWAQDYPNKIQGGKS